MYYGAAAALIVKKLIVNCVFCKHLVKFGLILGVRMMMIVASGAVRHHLILNVGLTSVLFQGFPKSNIKSEDFLSKSFRRLSRVACLFNHYAGVQLLIQF